MADPELYRKNKEEISGTRDRQNELAAQLEDAYERWEELESRNI